MLVCWRWYARRLHSAWTLIFVNNSSRWSPLFIFKSIPSFSAFISSRSNSWSYTIFLTFSDVSTSRGKAMRSTCCWEKQMDISPTAAGTGIMLNRLSRKGESRLDHAMRKIDRMWLWKVNNFWRHRRRDKFLFFLTTENKRWDSIIKARCEARLTSQIIPPS